MKTKQLFLLLFVVLGGIMTSSAQVTVTASGGTVSAPYTSLTAAFAAINAGTHQGIISISITASYTEVATAILYGSAGTSSYSSITITPSGGAWVVDGTLVGAPLIDLNGADNVKIDGLNTGGNALTFSNLSTSNTAATSTIRFINDATADTISNCTILGSATATLATAAGAVLFSTTNGTSGNDNNAIIGCDIGAAGTNIPYKAICTLGTGTSETTCNSDNLIQDCNIHDYFAGTTSTGIYLGAGTTDWVVNNNKFYQTATRTFTGSGTHSSIYFGSSVNNSNHQITNNTIGYSSSTGTGTYTIAQAGGSQQVIGIYISSAGNTTASTIQGNTITAISMSGTGAGTNATSPFVGIYFGSGLMNILGNTIGSQTTTGAISFTSSSATLGECTGIYIALSGSLAHTISDNLIGGITATNSSGAANIYGIKTSSLNTSNITIANNTIGGEVANSIRSTSTTTTSVVAGMYIASGPSCTITGNIVRNLSANGGTSATLGSVCGIAVVATTAQTVSQNTIYGLTNTNTTAVTFVNGLYLSISGANTINRNFIHSLNNASAAGTIQGIRITAGPIQCSNNMIRLGIDTAGADITDGLVINGINETSGANNFYHNSIYIGGSGVVGGSINTYAFNSTTTTTRNYINNIFMNARSNGTGTGQHYAVKVGGTVANQAGLTMKNNLFYANGTGGVFGYYNGTDIGNLGSWQLFVGGNTNSGLGNPQFVSPTGNSATVNLHIDSTVSTPVEGMGAEVAAVTIDIDSTLRNTTTPDIGADEGNFTFVDVYTPIISYTELFNHDATSIRTVSDFAAVTDTSGVNTTVGVRPRLYYKKPMDANTFISNSSSDDGWKYVEASGTTSPFSFDINYALLYSGFVSLNDTIQYFVVAQDMATVPNISINYGAFTTVPATVDLTAANFPILGTPNFYKIVNPRMNGTIYVGAGGSYPYTTLSAVAADLVARGIDASVQIVLMDAIYTTPAETFPISFGNIYGVDATHTITITPTLPATSIIGSNTTAIIELNNTHHVTLDGRISGSGTGKDLIIENTSTAAASTVRFINDAYRNTIQYCVVKGVATGAASGNIVFGTTTGTIGNDTNTIDNCDIKNGVSRHLQGIYALGSTSNTNVYNDSNIISNNNIYNHFSATVASSGIKVNAGNAGWTISNNSFFDTTTITYTANVTHRAIYLNSSSSNTINGSGFVVSNNQIGGNGPALSDTLRIISTGSANGSIYVPIECSVGMSTTNPTLIQNNTISNINFITSSSSSVAFDGINIERGVTQITGNTIGSATTLGAINFTSTTTGGGVFGIRMGSVNPMGPTTISNNTISGIDVKGSTNTIVAQWTGIASSGGTTVDITNNTIGSATMANAINASNPVVAAGNQTLRGIIINGASTTYTITGNVIANINTNTASTGTLTHTLMAITYSPGAANANPITISNNSIHDLSTSTETTQATPTPAIGGILVSNIANATGVLTINNNDIYGLKLTGAALSAAVNVRGIYIAGGASGSEVRNNKVHSFSVVTDNPLAVVTGIEVAGGASSYYNNIIRLGVNDLGADENVGYQINGIKDSIGTNNYYYNSVYIGGLAVNSGASNSFAFNSNVVTNTRSIMNNSFYNARSNSASTGKHYAVRVGGTTSSPTGLTMNNNLMYVSGLGGVFGLYNGADVADLTSWISTVGLNTASLSVNPLYTNPTAAAISMDLAPQSTSSLIGAGATVSGITTDIAGVTRATNSTIGAIEYVVPIPVQLLSFNGVKEQAGIRLTWVTASELNNAYFNVQRSLNGSDFETIATVKGKGTTQQLSTYSFVDTKRFAETKVYYRLVQVDFSQKSQMSAVVVITLNKEVAVASFTIAPNPFEGVPSLYINSETATAAFVRVIDLNGQVLIEKSILLEAGQNQIMIEEFLTTGKKGMYIIQVATPAGVTSQRALKLN